MDIRALEAKAKADNATAADKKALADAVAADMEMVRNAPTFETATYYRPGVKAKARG